MTLDPTQILLIALGILVAVHVLDVIKGIITESRMWGLINALVGGQRAPTFPPPSPPVVVRPPLGPVPVPDTGPLGPPDKPPVVPDKPPITPPITPPVTPPVPPVAARTPRNIRIVATSFAGTNDSTFSKTSAYTGKIIDSSKPGFALPKHLSAADQARTIRGFWNGKTVDGPPVDVGPWYPSGKGPEDAYWETASRPRAESDNRTNHAGIDLTPGAWRALGHPDPENAKDYIDWDWVDYLNGAVAPPVPIQPERPTQPPVTGGTVLQMNKWPTPAECPAFYGDDEATIRANLVNVQIPWLMNGKTHTIQIHKKCAESLTRIVNFIWETCGKSQDQIHTFGYDIFDGSFVPRNIAGTGKRSNHWYAAALDFNAARNPQHATAANTEFKEESLITTAFKREGWKWGGNWSPEYRDAMHYQAVDQ